MLRPRAAFRISSDRNNRAARCGLAARPYATGTNAGGQTLTRWRSSGPGQSSALGPRRDLAYLGAFPLSVEHISVERFSSWTSVGALHTCLVFPRGPAAILARDALQPAGQRPVLAGRRSLPDRAVPSRLQDGAGRDRVEAQGLDLSLRPLAAACEAVRREGGLGTMRLLGTPILGLALLDRSRPVNNRGVPLGPRRGENSGHRNLTRHSPKLRLLHCRISAR
jgi:hypothetical protein